MFDLAHITTNGGGGGGGGYQEQQKHDGCGKGRHDGVWGRVKSVFGDEEKKRKEEKKIGWVVFCLQRKIFYEERL